MRKLAACIFAGALVLAACGGDDDDTAASGTTEADSGATTTTAADAGAASDVVTTATTDLGEVLVDSAGKTIYAFTADSGGTPSCTGDCSGTWPAVAIQGEELPAGLDDSIFSVVESEDETYQLAANGQPLYTFSGDQAEGDTNGQGIGGKWFAVGSDGNMIQAAAGSGGGGGATTTTMGDDSGGDTGY